MAVRSARMSYRETIPVLAHVHSTPPKEGKSGQCVARTAEVEAFNALLLQQLSVQRRERPAQHLRGLGVAAHALQHVAAEAVRGHRARLVRRVVLLDLRERLLRVLHLHPARRPFVSV